METRTVSKTQAEKEKQLVTLKGLLEGLLHDAQMLGRDSMRKDIACAIDAGEASARDRYQETYLEFRNDKELFITRLAVSVLGEGHA